ncbi:hypothetical protein GCM10022243_14200 [Saccharothrix violaceirubra]|uniref:NAD(P)-dependent dehydrogenase (Short-subunit alcohol dehydrogenase family) n=1 Tax=Saccharothrix violaceirubra TaxID=413306 RepID=A0A7W7WXC3_9PSEU|nr:KR domain-containing protein [Saccharothrix violaceirubra]MBB4967294.1 NAD(P)-dependent dehydrogenase (short-subunit alcohol dehydrogenase family) [Saccharothrix violaceirubra]
MTARDLVAWLADPRAPRHFDRPGLHLRRPHDDHAATPGNPPHTSRPAPDAHPADHLSESPPAEPFLLDRHVLTWVEHPRVVVRPTPPALPPGVLVLTNSRAAVAGLDLPHDATVLVADGVSPVVAPPPSRHVRVLVDHGRVGVGWSPAVRALLDLHELLFLAARAKPDTLLVTLLDAVHDGVPGAFTGLFTGFVKSLALEFPDVPTVATLHEPGPVDQALARSVRELGARQHLPVVSYVDNRRRTPKAVGKPAGPGDFTLDTTSLVVAAGGARGIGAPILLALARRFRPRLLVLGSTEPDRSTTADKARYIREQAALGVPVGAASARFEKLREAREVDATLTALSELCGPGRVEYVRCDLRDPAAVRAAVAGRGRADLLLNIAGTNRAADVRSKSPDDFRAVRDLKLHTYLNLKDALRDRPPRRWLNFGSFVGFTGQLGETDYASANDFLNTAAGAAGGGESTTGWTLWRDTGLGATPIMRAFLAKSDQFTATPTAEGVAHFLAELGTPETTVFYGDKERAAIAAALPGYAHLRPLPFLDTVEHPSPTTLVATRTFDLARDGWLADHRVHGYPTLPGTFVPELAAEAALALVPHRIPVVFEDVRLHSFLRVYDERPRTKKITAELVSADEVESVVQVHVSGDVHAPDGRVLAADRPHFSAVVRLRDEPVPSPTWPHWDDHGTTPVRDPYHVPGAAVELTGVFVSTSDTRLHPHGKKALSALDPQAIRRDLPDLVVPSVLLDGLVRVAVLDLVDRHHTPVAVPRAIRRVDLYGTRSDSDLAGTPVRLYVTPADLDLEAEPADNRCVAVAPDGSVLMQVKDVIGTVVGHVDQRDGRFDDTPRRRP